VIPMYQIQAIPAFNDNYIWCIYDQESGAALVVDPGDAKPVEAFLAANKLTPEVILLTHHHPDHSAGIATLCKDRELPVYGPDNSPFERISHRVNESDAVTWRDFTFTVLKVPGHTLDHIAFFTSHYPADVPLLFSGDALFVCGCGRLFEGQPAQMRQSLEKLRKLPRETQVYCGHEYTLANLEFSRAVLPDDKGLADLQAHCQAVRENNEPTVPTTMEREAQLNPFLRWDDTAVVTAAQAYAADNGLPLEDGNPDQVFAAIRHWKDNF